MRIGFNGNQLKLIAVVSMLVDHMAYLFIGVGMLTPALQAGEEVPALFLLYRVLRAIGRMAFPVFCFFAGGRLFTYKEQAAIRNTPGNIFPDFRDSI